MNIRRKSLTIMLCLFVAIDVVIPISYVFSYTSSSSQKYLAKVKSKKKYRKSFRKRRRVRTRASRSYKKSNFAVGLNGGYEATYGNSVTFHYFPLSMLDINAGLGYNFSGPKIGAGSIYTLPMTKVIGLRGGASLVYSLGRTGEISLDAKFTPEDSDSDEDIEATKDFTIGYTIMSSFIFGGYYAWSKTIHFVCDLSYNFVLSGNEVTLKEGIQYNKSIEISNESSFDEEFDEKAKDKVYAGGPGISAGVRFFL